jgi:hypothetical protein
MDEALHFGPAAHAKVLYWPRTVRHGEPDALVMVTDGDDSHAIVLEAKYDAQKSNWDSTDPQDVDQLARYWKALNASDIAGVPGHATGRFRGRRQLRPSCALVLGE